MSRISGALLLAFLFLPLAQAFSSAEAISATGENATAPAIAFHGNGPAHMAWISQAGNESSWALMYSNDGLNGWADGVRLANLSAPALSPRIFADETGGISIVFSDAGGIYCIHSADSGFTWGRQTQVSAESNGFGAAQGERGKVGVVWTSGANTHMSELAGCVKTSAHVFMTFGGAHATPRIAANPKGGYGFVWLDNTTKEIMFAPSMSAKYYTVSNTIGNSGDPQIAYDSAGTAHIVWRDAGEQSGSSEGDWDIWHAEYSSEEMGAAKPIARTTGFPSWEPRIAISPRDIPYVLWVDGAPGSQSLVYSSSSDGGESWGQWSEVSGAANSPKNPLLIIDGNSRLHFFWESAGSSNALWHAGWNGTAWAGAGMVSNGSKMPFMYDVALDQMNRLHLAFSTGATAYEAFNPGFGRNMTMQLRLEIPQSACAGEPFTASVTDESGSPVANVEVSLSHYNEQTFAWEPVSSAQTGFGGAAQVAALQDGNHKVSAERNGFISASKYLEARQCSGPTPAPTATPEGTPSPTPAPTGPSPTPVPTQPASPTPAPTPGPSACPLGLLLAFPLLLLLRK